MEKSRKDAPLICLIVTAIALIGIIIGLITKNPIVIILLLLPTAIYEVMRTQGKSTKAASIILLVVLVAQIFVLMLDIDFNVAEFFGATHQYIGGYLLPLGELRIVAPALMAVLAVILFVRTWGVYTRWLAATIFFTSFALIYVLDPQAFQDLFAYAAQQGLRYIR